MNIQRISLGCDGSSFGALFVMPSVLLGMTYAFVGAVCLLASTKVVGEEAPPATVSIEKIYQEATQRQKLIHSLQVKYVVTIKQTLALPEYPLGYMDATEKFEVTFMGNKRLLRYDYQSRQGENDVKSIDLYTTEQWFEYKPGVLNISRNKKANMEGAEIYCRSILQIPLSDAEQAQYDNAWFYPHVLREIGGSSKYQLLPKQEKVDGAWCLVVENPGFDKIWIDPNLQYMFRRRDRFEPVERGKESVPFYSYRLRDFKMVSGVWVPMSCTITNYVWPSQPQEYWGKKWYEQDIKVDNIEINKVTDKDFDFEVPAGTVLMREHGAQRIPGDKTGLLSELGLLAQEHTPARPEPRNISWFLVLNVVVFVILLAVFVMRRIWQRRGRVS